ncbi:MAG: hypothetical protein KDE55_11005 [Novosphingobium sp.]|nr:hypothetical protein [Novosphingobium sp.]
MWPDDFEDKPAHRAMWSKGGASTLVRILPADMEPDPSRLIGQCTMIGHLVGRTAFEMELAIGRFENLRFMDGLVVYKVAKLPRDDGFVPLNLGTRPSEDASSESGAAASFQQRFDIPRWLVTGLNESWLTPLAELNSARQFHPVLERLGPVR